MHKRWRPKIPFFCILQGGLSDDIAAVVVHTILGDGWPEAPAWQAKWKQVTVLNLLQCFTTLGSRDDISERLGTIRVPGGGHASNLTHPGPVNAALVDFLKDL